MGRRKIEIKAIKDDRNRSVTFLKRKGGLFKKAHELSVLCSVDVAVFIFGSNKKLYEYSSADMRELMYKYHQHGAPQEHKGPVDFHGGGDDDEDEDVDGTPPRGLEGSVEPQMMPPQYPSQPPFARLHHHTPSASPPITGMAYVPRGHTPQPQMGSRPSSRNDFRRPPSVSQPGVPQPPPVANGYAFMPQPAIYNPQNQANMAHGMPHQPHPQYPYPPPQPHPQMHSYIEEQRRASVPPGYPPQSQPARPHPSPPHAHQQQLPPQASTHMSPPQPPHQHIEPPPQPQPQHQQQIEAQAEPQPPLAPMEIKRELSQERAASQPFLDTASAIKKIPQRKQHSIFTPIDENRSILSQHLASFDKESSTKDDGNNRAQSVDVGAVARTNGHSSPPPPPQRSNTSALAKSHVPTSSRPEPTFSPPSRSNSLKSGGGARPRLKVQIPDEQSDAGSNTAESNTSPRTTADPTQRNGTEPQSASVVVLPPPSPSAQTLLSAGATGPPNPFARPPPHSQNNSNMNIDTPVSALPSRFLNNEFLPSPSSFYPEWNFRGNDSNTLPSPLNFATPVVGSGPSFLRDDNPPGTNKRKSPEISASGPTSDGAEAVEAKRIKIDG